MFTVFKLIDGDCQNVFDRRLVEILKFVIDIKIVWKYRKR